LKEKKKSALSVSSAVLLQNDVEVVAVFWFDTWMQSNPSCSTGNLMTID
jgi:hypothetical protein